MVNPGGGEGEGGNPGCHRAQLRETKVHTETRDGRNGVSLYRVLLVSCPLDCPFIEETSGLVDKEC